MITKIELIETLETMGAATEEDLFRWCDNLRSKLLGEYPGTDVEVKAVADTSHSKIHIEVDDETDTASVKDTVQKVIKHWSDLWSKIEG